MDDAMERGIATLIGVAACFAILLFGAVRATELAWVTFMVGAAAVMWITRMWSGGSHRWILHPVLWPVLGFVAFAAWRASGTDVPYVAWQEVSLLGLYAMTMVVALHNMHAQGVLNASAWVASISGGLLGIYAMGQYLGESESVLWLARPSQYWRRAGGTFVNPNHYAALTVLLLPMALAHAFLARARLVVRVVHGYAALMMLGGLAVSMSRGGWIAGGLVVAGFLAWLAARRRQMRVPAAAAMALVVITSGAFLAFNAKARLRLAGIGADGVPDSGDRLPLWRPALAMWRDHPWTGVGPGHYDVFFPRYREPSIQLSPGHAHNEYLNTLADYGIVGLGLVASALVVMAASAWLSRKYVERASGDLGDKGSNRTAFFVGATLGLGGLAIHCLGEFAMHVPAIGIVAMVLTGQLASMARFASDRWWFTPGTVARVLVTMTLLLSVGWLFPSAWRGFREARLLGRAHRIGQVNPDLVGLLRAAAEACPGNPRTAYELGDTLRRAWLFSTADWAGSLDEHLAWLAKSAALNPHDPLPHMAIAESWLRKGDLDKALAASSRARDLAPNLVAAADLHGTILFRRRDYPAARAAFQKSIEWNPWSSHYARAYVEACDKVIGTAGTPGAR